MPIPPQLKPFIPSPRTWTATRAIRATRHGALIGVLVTFTVLLAEAINLADQNRLTFDAILSSRYSVFAFLAVTVWFIAQLTYGAQLKTEVAEERARQARYDADAADQQEFDRQARHNTIERNSQFEFARRFLATRHLLTASDDETTHRTIQTGTCSCGKWNASRRQSDGSHLITHQHDTHIDAVTLDALGYAPLRDDEPVTV